MAANYRDVNVLLPDAHWGLCRCALLVLFFYATIPFLPLCVIALLSFCVSALCPTPAAISLLLFVHTLKVALTAILFFMMLAALWFS